jgi:leader peptidase (prepilin peptidase)/N-methyltransferase
MSLWRPPSHCPKCNHRLGVVDLAPLLSLLLSRGRCRYCRAPVGWRYFFVELVTGLVWAGFWWRFLVLGQDPVSFVLYAAFGCVLLAALFIDLEHYIIPDSLNAWLLPVAAASNVHLVVAGSGGWTQIGGVSLPSALAGYLVGWGTLFGIALLGRILLGKDAMGHGDIKLARGLGAMLGPALAVGAFALAVVAGAILGAAQVAARRLWRPQEPVGEEVEVADDEAPEPIGSLLKCGLGYLFLVDVVALFRPSLNRKWFGDDPEESEWDDDDWAPSLTTIPFGPYLVVGSLVAATFPEPVLEAGRRYIEWATGVR